MTKQVTAIIIAAIIAVAILGAAYMLRPKPVTPSQLQSGQSHDAAEAACITRGGIYYPASHTCLGGA